jgi:hypothetical protein
MTELIWEGKYKEGKKLAPVRISLPFQTIETINESAADRARNLDLFASGRETDWRNRLIWGDKKYVLPSLLPEFSGKVNLIYIDPPFDTGADFSFTATIPDHPDTEQVRQAHRREDETTSFVKQPSIIEQKAYRDTWGAAGWIRTCSGFMKPRFCCVICWPMMGVFMCIWIGILELMRNLFLMKFSAQTTVAMKSSGNARPPKVELLPAYRSMVGYMKRSISIQNQKATSGTSSSRNIAKNTWTSHIKTLSMGATENFL